MDDDLADICGYTDAEIDANFKEHIQAWADRDGLSYSDQRERLQNWYNGYRFSKSECRVYSPFSFMKALKARSLENFWFSSATPTFLVEELRKQQRENPEAFKALLENKPIEITQRSLGSFDIGLTPLSALLFQTGYLTIVDYNRVTNSYRLNYPNHEVEQSFQLYLLSIITNLDSAFTENLAIALSNALVQKNITAAIQVIKDIFSYLPYQIHGKDETYYHAILYIALTVAGLAAQAELSTSRGRADIAIDLQDVIYIIEVKFNKSAAKAIEQIEERKYYEQFLHKKKDIILLGIAFRQGRGVFEIEYEAKTLDR